MTPLRFAIVGAGNIAPLHAAAIAATPDAELVAVVDRNQECGQAFAAERGVDCLSDYHEALARPDIDVLTLCLPHHLHVTVTEEAAAAGKHVICEKPMARNTAECDRMIAACDAAGVQLGIVFQARFGTLATRLKAGLDEGRLGELVWASSSTLWYRDAAYYKSSPWRGTWAQEGGGVLINQASHNIDLLVWLAGMPRSLVAQTKTAAHEIEVEDNALAMLDFGRASGLIQATTNAFPGYPERLEFFGTSGSVVYHKGQGQLEWHLRDPRTDLVETVETSSGAARPMDISAAGHIAMFQDFAAAVREGRRPAVDGHEGRKSVRVIEAIYESAAIGAPVRL